ncbi:MAG TPA: 50S ribosomal protein L32 [Candidatus Latescibacteria bacterium]|nr:50S ribosomal protein L32 [Candidatus Latescibacterota bacterium]
MALPKRKTSKSRRDNRRAHWKVDPPVVAICSHCHQPKLPHRICPNCGYYDGKQVIISEEK